MTSDCLFPGRVGKTWEPAAFEELLRDVTARIFEVYRDDTVVHPGHGDNTTLGTERAHWQSGANAAGDVLRPSPAWPAPPKGVIRGAMSVRQCPSARLADVVTAVGDGPRGHRRRPRTGPATRIVPAVPVIVAVTPSHPGCADAQHDRQARVRGGRRRWWPRT